MKHIAAAILLSIAIAAGAPAGPVPPGTAYTVIECRSQAAAERMFDRTGIPELFSFHPEEAPILEFLRGRDIAYTSVIFNSRPPQETDFHSFSPDDRQAFFELLAAESWTNEPDAPEGWQVVVPPSGSFRYCIAAADGKTAVSENPDALRAALDLQPSLPASLPAEGDIAGQIRPDCLQDSAFDPDRVALVRRNVDSLSAGLGLDGDTLALHAVLAPVPGSDLVGYYRSLGGPIPPSTACVNLPGAVAFYADASDPSLPDAFRNVAAPSFMAGVDRRRAGQPSSIALFPPAGSDAPGTLPLPRAVAFAGLVDTPTARTALLSLFARHSDTASLVPAAPHRDIPVDTLAVADPVAFARHLDKFGGGGGATPCAILAQGLAAGKITLSLAWLPDGLLLAANDADFSLLHAAIDAALDGTATPFDQTPAFRAAYPEPDAPACAIAHLDLPALLAGLPQQIASFIPAIPDPCSIDFFGYIADDGSLAARLRAPADLVKAFFGHGRTATKTRAIPDEPPPRVLSWDDPIPFETTSETITSRDIDAEAVAFWREFLEPPAGLDLPVDDFARLLALGWQDGAEAAAYLLQRTLPEFAAGEGAPDLPSLSLPWAHAVAALRQAAGQTDDAVAAWLAVATHGDGGDAPVPEADRSWRDLFASAMAADRYLTATTNWTDPDTLSRRAALRPLGARRAALVVSQLNPTGLRGRVFGCILCPDNANFAFPEDASTPSPLAAAFTEIGESNAVASSLIAFSEIRRAWKSRGGGWASDVTDEGWQGFRKHMASGIAWAERAHALEPRWPEPYVYFIEQAGSSCGSGRPESIYELARQCLECQIDYTYVLSRLRTFMRPRWGNGAPAEALRTLRALVDIPRPDTVMPFKSLEMLEWLTKDQLSRPSDRRAYARAGYPVPLDLDLRLWPAFRDMFERYLAAPEPGVPRPEVFRAYLQTAARFRDPAPALAALDRLPPDELAALWTEPDNPSVPRGASLVGVGGIPILRAAAELAAAAPGALSRHAAALATGDKDAAAAAFDDICSVAADSDSLAQLAVIARIGRDQHIAFDWEPGGGRDEIDQPGPITFYREGASWVRLPTGGWLAYRVRGHDGHDGASIDLWRKKTTDAAADFTILSHPAEEGADPAACGYYIRLHASPAHCVGVAVFPFAGSGQANPRCPAEAYLTDPDDFHVRHPFATAEYRPGWDPAPDFPAILRLRIRCENGLLDAWLDGDPLFTSVPVPDTFPRKTDYHPAFGTTSPSPSPAFSIDRIRLGTPSAPAPAAPAAPSESRFKPRPLPAHADPLGDLFGGDLLDSEGNPADPADLEGQYIGLYFSASWCPPCRTFTPRLVEFADRLRDEGKPFALVLVGCDATRDASLEYMKTHHMTAWLIPPESDARKRLDRLLDVEYIPKLCILDPRTRIIDFDARTTVEEAPDDAWTRWTR